MSDPAVRVEGVGKQYRLGRRDRYPMLRDRIVDIMTRPFGVTRSASARAGAGPSSQPERFWALRDVTFEIGAGAVIGIIGRNGAGKSTLLKVLARITEPTEGRLAIRGRVGSLLEVGTGFHPELTGRENIFLNGAILGMRRAEIARKFDDIVAFSEVERFIDTPVKHFSSGMYMRLAFAVAAHLEPEILLIDEVLAVGDAQFQKKCLGKMGDVAKQGRTIVFVSHNLAAVERLCERTLWLDGGGVKRDGPSLEVVSAYQSQYMSAQPFWRRSDTSSRRTDLTFLTIGLEGASTGRAGLFAGNDAIAVCIEYAVERPLPACEIGLRLYTADNAVLFTTTDSDAWGGGPTAREPGVYLATVTIPGGFLAPGTYSVFVAAYSPFRTMYEVVDQSVVFDVGAVGSLVGQDGRLGAITPVLNWTTNQPATA